MSSHHGFCWQCDHGSLLVQVRLRMYIHAHAPLLCLSTCTTLKGSDVLRCSSKLSLSSYTMPITTTAHPRMHRVPMLLCLPAPDSPTLLLCALLPATLTSVSCLLAGYVGCFRYDGVRPKVELYDHLLFDGGHNYPLRARGSAYALSADVVRKTIVRNFEDLRLLQLEGMPHPGSSNTARSTACVCPLCP